MIHQVEIGLPVFGRAQEHAFFSFRAFDARGNDPLLLMFKARHLLNLLYLIHLRHFSSWSSTSLIN